MKEFELVFYRKANGECPVSEFLTALNKVMRYKMMQKFDMLELYGNLPKGDFTKYIDDGIFEIRAQTKTDITRVLFFFDKNRQIVLLNGFVKKTQRIPASELETAKRYCADHLARARSTDNGIEVQENPPRTTNGPQWRPKLDDIVSDVEERRGGSVKQQPQNKQHSSKRR